MLRLVSDEIEEYAERHTTPLPALLVDLQMATHERMGRHAQMLSGQVEGMLLQMLARAVGSRRILEFGTFAGLSAQMMAAALPEDGELNDTIQADPRVINVLLPVRDGVMLVRHAP